MCIVEIKLEVFLSFLKKIACNKRVSAPSERKYGRTPHTRNIMHHKNLEGGKEMKDP